MFIFPGQRICNVEDGAIAGNGTYLRNGFVYASLAGYLQTEKTQHGQVQLYQNYLKMIHMIVIQFCMRSVFFL